MQDPITLEVLKHAFLSASQEEATVMRRTAYSLNIRERTDYSAAICSSSGQLISQALRTPIHLGGVAPSVKITLADHGSDIHDGDIFIANDPYRGGQHPPDVQITIPVFFSERLIGFACALGHHQDVGGRVPGGMSTQSQEIFEEGLRLSHLKLYEAGRPSRSVMRFIRDNVRYPDTTMGDLQAQIAACRTGARRLIELCAKYGPDAVIEGADALMDISERRMRSSLSAIPEGTYRFTDHLDSDGVGNTPCDVAVAVTLNGGHLTVDFAGTSLQGRGSINSCVTATHSAVYYATRILADPDIMQNEGCTRVVTVMAPEGTLVNPAYPAACAGRSNIAHRIVDAIFGAIAEVAPDRVETPAYGTSPCYTIFGNQGSKRVMYMDCNHGSSGARMTLDGNDSCTSKTSNPQNLPIESCEAALPIEFLTYEFVPDSGGPGRFRGGLAIDRTVKSLFAEAQVEVRTDRMTFPPYGFMGGKPGMATVVEADRSDGVVQPFPSCATIRLNRNDAFRVVSAGAGGFGDPLMREVASVLSDFVDGKVSREGAERDYGVVIAADGSIDQIATATRRAGKPALAGSATA